MQPSAFQRHATRIVDRAMRAAFVSVVAIPLLLFLSMSGGIGTEPPEHGEQFFGVALFIVLAPAHYTLVLLHALGISFGFVDWMLTVIVVPLFWGAAFYCVGQLCRVLLRLLRPTPNHL